MTKTPTVQGAARARTSPPVATALAVNIKSVQVGVNNSETNLTYAAEDALDLEMPTRVLSLIEANDWLAIIAEAEGVDPPLVFRSKMSEGTEALALSTEWCIAVRDSKPTQLLLLHEMAHLLCVNKNHGNEFRTELIRLTRRYVSLLHAVALHRMFVFNDLTTGPIAATTK